MFARGSLGCQALFFHSSDFVAYSHLRNDRNSAGAAQPPGKTGVMRSIANRLAQVPGVVAVTLGGSRASGTATDDSDWDFGLYYRGTIDPAGIRALGWPGRVFAPGDWGRIVDGGAWLTIDGIKVDLIYRDIDVVTHWVAEAEDGRFEIQREVGYVAGIATYILAGELAEHFLRALWVLVFQHLGKLDPRNQTKKWIPKTFGVRRCTSYRGDAVGNSAIVGPIRPLKARDLNCKALGATRPGFR